MDIKKVYYPILTLEEEGRRLLIWCKGLPDAQSAALANISQPAWTNWRIRRKLLSNQLLQELRRISKND